MIPQETPDFFEISHCQVEIPGIGRCEIIGEHEHDPAGNEIHIRGACTWNGVTNGH